MYGIFLPGLSKQRVKLLEIGLGCGMPYGAGASIPLWKGLLPRADVWIAEFNVACVHKFRNEGKTPGVQFLTGDQENPEDVERWVRESGGKFDVIIDDGGHKNSHILNSFQGLWGSLNPGGLYFIEDMQVGRQPEYFGSTHHVMAEVIEGWVDALLMAKSRTVLPLPAGLNFIFCQREACVLSKGRGSDEVTAGPKKNDELWRCGSKDPNIAAFAQLASSLRPVTDKVTTHTYQTMYGIFLPGLSKQRVKLLEIGLGCGMPYGAGASIPLWKGLLPRADVWIAEFNVACVHKFRNEGKTPGVQFLTGDQENPEDVERWVRESGGKFDVIIDDGGHKNSHILNSFQGLWGSLNPGGLYFIEDMQVGRQPEYFGSTHHVMAEVIEGWVDALLMAKSRTVLPLPARTVLPLPAGLNYIFCQREACVLSKVYGSD